MTGFGSAEDRVSSGRLRIEIRTVNHRYFNAQLKLPADLGGVDLAFVARHPDVLTATNGGAGSEPPVQWADVQPVVERAARDVVAMREREGQALAAELTARLDALEAAARTIEEQAPARLTAEHERLKQAVAAARAALTSDQAVGKQLGFLAQELLREVNTMGSKANDARITHTVIAMKGDLEKFREQLENLE